MDPNLRRCPGWRLVSPGGPRLPSVAAVCSENRGEEPPRGRVAYPMLGTLRRLMAHHERDEGYRAIFEASTDGLAIHTPDGLIVEANRAFCRMHGYARGDLIGRNLAELVHAEFHRLLDQDLASSTDGSGEFPTHCVNVRSDGTEFHVDLIRTNFQYHGRPHVLAVMRESNDVLQAQEVLERRVAERTREIERQRNVAEGLRDLLATVNSRTTLDEVLDYIVAQAVRLLGSDAGAIYVPDAAGTDGLLTARAAQGLDAEDVARKLHVGAPATGLAFSASRAVAASDLLALIPAEHERIDQPEFQERDSHLQVLRVPAHQDPRATAGVWRIASRYRAVLAVPIAAKDEGYGALTLYYRECREFAADEVGLATAFAGQAALAIENARLYEQAQQAAALEERQRLARELHDAVTQTLFSTALIAEVLPDLWELDQADGRRSLEELRRLTRGALAEMRTLLVELRPGALVELPLPDLLRQLAEATAGRTRLEVTASVDGEPHGRVRPDVQVALYRIAQEALSNTVKHAGARRATLSLRHHAAGGLGLRIEDDGRGFDPAAIPPGHLGVGIMRERAEAFGGTLVVESTPGHGTRVHVEWRDTEASA